MAMIDTSRLYALSGLFILCILLGPASAVSEVKVKFDFPQVVTDNVFSWRPKHCPSIDGQALSISAKHQDMLTWMTDNGATFPSIAVVELQDQHHRDNKDVRATIGVVASDELNPGTALLHVPHKLQMTVSQARRSRFFQKFLKRSNSSVRKLLRTGKGAHILQLWIIQEMRLGSASFYEPYLKTLPQISEFLPFWSANTVLGDPAQENWSQLGLVNVEADAKRVYNKVVAPLMKAFPTKFPATHFTLEAFTHVMLLTSSHAFQYPSPKGKLDLGLIPLADLIHKKPQTGAAAVSFKTNRSGTEVTGNEVYHACEQIFLDAGIKSSAELLVHHDFVPSDNLDERIVVVVTDSKPLRDIFPESPDLSPILGHFSIPMRHRQVTSLTGHAIQLFNHYASSSELDGDTDPGFKALLTALRMQTLNKTAGEECTDLISDGYTLGLDFEHQTLSKLAQVLALVVESQPDYTEGLSAPSLLHQHAAMKFHHAHKSGLAVLRTSVQGLATCLGMHLQGEKVTECVEIINAMPRKVSGCPDSDEDRVHGAPTVDHIKHDLASAWVGQITNKWKERNDTLTERCEQNTEECRYWKHVVQKQLALIKRHGVHYSDGYDDEKNLQIMNDLVETGYGKDGAVSDMGGGIMDVFSSGYGGGDDDGDDDHDDADGNANEEEKVSDIGDDL